MRGGVMTCIGVAALGAAGALALARGGLNPPPGPVAPTNIAVARAAPEPSRIRSFTVRDIAVTGARVELVPLSALEGFAGFVITDVVGGTSAAGTAAAENGRLDFLQGPDPAPVSYRVRVRPQTFSSGLSFGTGAPIDVVSADFTGMWVTVTGYVY